MGAEGVGPELRELVVAGDAAGTASACEAITRAGTAVADRSELLALCAEILDRGWWSDPGYTQEQVDAAAIVTMTQATITEIRRVRGWHLPRDTELAHRLLAARDEAFRSAWVELAVEQLGYRDLRIARHLIHDGRAAKPRSDAYTIALVAHPGSFDRTAGFGFRRRVSVLDVLRANPDLLVDDVWRLFEVEGGGQNSLAAHDKYCGDGGWRAALLALSADGTLDRQRLLDAGLEALSRGFAQFRAQWFSAFHESLAPTLAERAARSSAYLALTASPIGPTVSMALRALTQVQRAGALDPVEVVAHLGPALLAPAKGSASKAVILVATAAGADPELVPEAGAMLVVALGHPAADVQQAALGHLRRWFPDPPDGLVAQVRSLRSGCHPSVRSDIDDWLGTEPVDPAVRPAHRNPAGPTPPASVTTVDWTAAERELASVDDLDELLERASVALEAPESPEDLEVLLAAVAAEGRARVGQDARAAALARRAATLSTTDHEAQRLVARSLTAWLAPDRLAPNPAVQRVPDLATPGPSPVSLDDLLRARVESVVRSLLGGEPFTPLAAPTHRHGIIDPVVLAERIGTSMTPPHPAELTVALLRLAPSPGRLSEAVRVLGQSTDIPPSVRPWFERWADHCEAHAGRPARWTCTERDNTGAGYIFHDLHVEGLGAITPPEAPVTVTLAPEPWAGRFSGLWGGRFAQDPIGVSWMGSLIPGLPGAWARLGAWSVGPTYGTPETAHGHPAYLERFFDDRAPLTGDAYLLLALTLNDQRPPVQTAAVDLVIAALDDGRLRAELLGDQVGRLASTGLVVPARWARSLADVAGHGPDHGRAVAHCLEQAVAVAEPRKPQDLLALLELLEVLLLDAGSGVATPAARHALARFTGGSKTARTARRLLAADRS